MCNYTDDDESFTKLKFVLMSSRACFWNCTGFLCTKSNVYLFLIKIY